MFSTEYYGISSGSNIPQNFQIQLVLIDISQGLNIRINTSSYKMETHTSSMLNKVSEHFSCNCFQHSKQPIIRNEFAQTLGWRHSGNYTISGLFIREFILDNISSIYMLHIWTKCDPNIPCIVACMIIIYILSTNVRNVRRNTSNMGVPYR